MFDVRETSTGLVYRADMQSRITDLIRKVPSEKARKDYRRMGTRNLVTLSIVNIFGNSPVSSRDSGPVIIHGERTTRDKAFSHILAETLQDYPKFRPSLWRDTAKSVRLRAIYYQRAIDSYGGYTFTVNLAPHVARRLLDKGLNDLNEALKRNLEARLGRRVEYYVVVETSIEPRKRKKHADKRKQDVYDYRLAKPHLHGALVCTADEVPLVKEALHALNRRAGPSFNKTRAVDVDDTTDGFGWCNYILKHKTFCRLSLPRGNDTILASSVGIRKEAERIYEQDRHLILSEIEKMKEILNAMSI